MDEVTVGNVVISCDNHRLTFKSREDPRRQVTISAASLPDVLYFLQSVNPSGSDQRVAFRVPLDRKSALRTTLGVGSLRLPVLAVDISLSGMLVEMPTSLHELTIGSSVEITLELDMKSATLGGTVKRRIENRYGIIFADCQMEGDLDPPGSLMVIFRALERTWLARKVE